MKRHVNLMSDAARFRVAARVALHRWALALAVLATLLAPISIWHWQECRRIRHEHEASEASYAPIRRLNDMNAELRTTAASLVRDQRLTLQLSRRRPAWTLLGIVTAATAATGGSVYVEHIDLAQTPPGGAASTPSQNVLTIEAVCPPQFDIATFVDALDKPPFTEVKITSDDLSTRDGVDRKTYTIECRLSASAGKDSHAQ
jgi:hypothetical protein